MNAKSGFQRSFLIFTSEDAGYEAGQKPSGYVKIEVREGRGKLSASIQNLRPGNGRFRYGLYLLRTGRDGVVPVYAGNLPVEFSKVELDWRFEPRNVGMSGYGIEEFDMAAVLVEYADRQGNAVVCPLAAYMNKKVEWRSGLRKALLKKQTEVTPLPATPPSEETGGGNAAPSAAQPVEKMTESIEASWGQEAEVEGTPADNDYEYGEGGFEEAKEMQDYMQIEPEKTEQEWSKPSVPMQLPFWANPAEEPEQKQEMKPPEASEQKQEMIPPETSEQKQEVKPTEASEQKQEIKPTEEPEQKQEMKPPETSEQKQSKEWVNGTNTGAATEIDTGCVYLNGNLCGAFVNNGTIPANPCASCRMHKGQAPEALPAGDIAKLREELDRYFEKSDPFHSRRSDYTWWKVTNPVNLNNLLYQCNIRSPLLFNPVVMMAHYKYRHLIIGIFHHKIRNQQYVVCGVPGMHMVDRMPFGDMSRWVQAEGNRPKYGAFGYWLAYIDPDDGKILNMGQE